MADDVWMSNQDIDYDLNLLDKDFKNSRKLEVSIGIPITTIDMCNSIHKTAFIGKQTEIDSKLNNRPDIYPSNAITELLGKLVS